METAITEPKIDNQKNKNKKKSFFFIIQIFIEKRVSKSEHKSRPDSEPKENTYICTNPN